MKFYIRTNNSKMEDLYIYIYIKLKEQTRFINTERDIVHSYLEETEYKRIFAIGYKDIGWKRFIEEITTE